MNRKNLRRLATYLLNLPQQGFSMWSYMEDTPCGTVACAVGYGPRAGIGHIAGVVTDDWDAYCNRELINTDGYLHEWQWCFSSTWMGTDNTPQGAAKRILWLLDKGLPEDHAAQRYGHAPLCYLEER